MRVNNKINRTVIIKVSVFLLLVGKMDASDVKSVPDIKVEPIDEDNIVNDDKNLYLQNYNDFDKEIMPNVVTKLGNTMGKTDSVIHFVCLQF